MADLIEFGGWPLMDLLPGRLRACLRKAANPVRYQDGALIHAGGDAKPGLSIVHQGAVRFGNPGEDGSYVTTSILGPGHCFGEATLFAGLPRTHDAVAVGDTVVDQIGKKRFDQIFNAEPELSRIMLVATTRRLYTALEFMDDLRRLPLRARTAKLIATMADASKTEGVVECNQTDLAFTLGVSRVSAGTALGGLQKDRLIKLGYGKIYIPNRKRLDDWIADHIGFAPLGPPGGVGGERRRGNRL